MLAYIMQLLLGGPEAVCGPDWRPRWATWGGSGGSAAGAAGLRARLGTGHACRCLTGQRLLPTTSYYAMHPIVFCPVSPRPSFGPYGSEVVDHRCWARSTPGLWLTPSPPLPPLGSHSRPHSRPRPLLPPLPTAVDHSYWVRPEEQAGLGIVRTVYAWNASQPASDLLGMVRAVAGGMQYRIGGFGAQCQVRVRLFFLSSGM